MFLGHIAVGLAGKRAAPSVSLGTWVLAVQFVDLIWPFFLLAGLEHVRIAPGITAFTPLDFYDYPITHSLVGGLIWAALLGGIWLLRGSPARVALLLGAGVLSHWVLDVISHRPDMPVLPNGPYVGLGLWHSVPATLAVELTMFALGVMLYLRGRVIDRTAPRRGSRRDPVTTITLGAKGAKPVVLAAGDLRMVVIRRGDRFGIRMRDLNSPMRRAFKGLEYYPIEPSLRIAATFVPYDEPRKIPIPNVLGQTPEMVSPGYVTFTVDGREQRLEPVYETSEHTDLFFIFSDATSRGETYPAGRFLHAPLPVNGTVVLDFNKAYNPPCAFTDFATCPLPPRQNRLPVRIEAGELAYHGPTR